jgi:predicted esterase
MPPKAKETKALFRVLMLHGNRQNEEVFKDKTGGVRKKIKNLAEFVYCDAPNLVPKLAAAVDEVEAADEPEDQADQPVGKSVIDPIQKCWFLRKSDQTEEDSKNFVPQFEKTLDYIDNVFKVKGPFDAVWGFSQGATIASILSRIAEQNQNGDNVKYKHIDFKFVIVASTSIGQNEPELFVYFDKANKLTMPSLHMMGKADRIINYEKSLELSEHYVNPDIYLHDSGHFIPRNQEAKVVFTNFFNKMYEQFSK